jgi:hypothetical protein
LSVSRPVVAAPSRVKSDLEIVQALAARVGLADALAGSARSWKARLVATRLAEHGIELDDLEREALRNPLTQPLLFADRKFFTPSGKVNLITEPPPTAALPPGDYPLYLLALLTRESQSSPWVDRAPSPPQLTLHPSAAASLPDGAACEIESPLGRMLDPRQRPDVALVPKGGTRAAGSCANSLIEAKLTDIGDGGALYEECVRLVTKISGRTDRFAICPMRA